MINGGDPAIIGGFMRLAWGLLVVIGVMLIIYGLLRKKLSLVGGDNKSEIKVMEIKHLGQKKALCLVEVDGQKFLLGIGSESINMLADIGSVTPAEDSKSFVENLNGAEKQYGQLYS